MRFQAATKKYVDTLFKALTNAIAVHNNSEEAHQLGPLRTVVIENTSVSRAASALLFKLMPVVFSDDFERADNATLGSNWTTFYSKSASVKSGAAVAPVNTVADICGNVKYLGVADQVITANLYPTPTGEASLLLRVSDSQNHILVQQSNGTVFLYFVVAGTYTLHATPVPEGLTQTDTLQIEAVGNTLTVRLSERLMGTYTIPAQLSSGLQAGLRIARTGQVLNWTARTPATSSTSSGSSDAGKVSLLLSTSTFTVLGKDSFDRPDAASIGSAETGGAWNTLINTAPAIVGNSASVIAGKTEGAYLSLSAKRIRITGKVRVTALPQLAGLQVGTTIPAWMFVQAHRTGNSVFIRRYDDTIKNYVTVATIPTPLQSAPEDLSMVCIGDTIYVILDGDLKYTATLPSVSTTFNLIGFVVSETGKLDNFDVWSF